MHTPRFSRLPALLSLILVATLAGCDENAPTETRAPVRQIETGPGGDGSELRAQADISAATIALPVNQSVATTGTAPAFRVNQTGTGPNGIFQITRAASTQIAVQGLTNGRGRAGLFQITNALNTQGALQGQTNGSGFAVYGVATGTGGAGDFVVGNPQGGTALTVATIGRGPVFVADQIGTGTGGIIRINNGHNARTALEVVTYGTGLALDVTGPSHFLGDVVVQGTLTKSAGSFKIDHPLDPEHKYLSHSFVESPDMKNVYDGTVTLDANGRATVELPDYFEALNKDLRYQLTAIGAPGPNLYIAQGVEQNRFRIAGGRAYAHVSWQVTGVRQDAYAEEHRIKVEEDKPAAEQGLIARR